MREFYLVARDDESVKLPIGRFADWLDAVAYINANHPSTWSRGWRVSSGI